MVHFYSSSSKIHAAHRLTLQHSLPLLTLSSLLPYFTSIKFQKARRRLLGSQLLMFFFNHSPFRYYRYMHYGIHLPPHILLFPSPPCFSNFCSSYFTHFFQNAVFELSLCIEHRHALFTVHILLLPTFYFTFFSSPHHRISNKNYLGCDVILLRYQSFCLFLRPVFTSVILEHFVLPLFYLL